MFKMLSLAVELAKKDVVSIVEIDIPDPSIGQVQVRTEYSLISPGTERAYIKKLENVNIKYPSYLGYSLSGIVEKVGKGVKIYKEGDRVACKAPHKSVVNVSEQDCVNIPEGVSLKEASFIELGNICLQGIRKASIEPGESVMVLGLGLIGQIVLQIASFCGGMPVIGVDKADKRLEIARRNKADYVLNTNNKEWLEKLLSLTSGNGASVVIESTGFPDPINLALKAAANLGRVILLGSTRGLCEVDFYKDVHLKGLKVIGAHVTTVPKKDSYYGYWTQKDNYQCFIDLLNYKKIDMNNLISDVVMICDIQNLYKRITSWDDSIIAALIQWR